jgi:uncharacterized protein YndB with AHSA1/START domain
MEKTLPAERRRAFEMALEIAASPEDVWRALTEARELVRWFPLDARVTPGVGGTMLWNWGDGWDWESRIEAWEPGRRLRLVQDDARPADAEGKPIAPGETGPARIAMEFTLETHQGKTRLRLVHSGFGEGAAWDNELEGITEGWQAELRSLRFYLERHRGRDRYPGRAWLTTAVPREAAWDRLTGPDGFRIDPANPREGDAYSVTTPGGEHFSGMVQLHLPGQTLAGTVAELDDGWFRLLTWRDAAGDTGVWAWVSTYGSRRAEVDRFREQAQATLAELFGGVKA